MTNDPTDLRHGTVARIGGYDRRPLILTADLLFQVLRLEGNQLEEVPSTALAGPRALTVLTLQENHIGELS